MQVFDPRTEYEPAIQFFQACAPKLKPHTHLRIAKWGFWLVIGFIVIALVWHGRPA